jgi:hypothetical protein
MVAFDAPLITASGESSPAVAAVARPVIGPRPVKRAMIPTTSRRPSAGASSETAVMVASALPARLELATDRTAVAMTAVAVAAAVVRAL